MNRARPIKTLIAAISGNTPPDVNWDAVLIASNNTLTTGTLAHWLLSTQNGAPLPDDARQFLTVIRDRTAQRNRQMQEQLNEVVACLNKVGVSPVLFKGAAILQAAESLGLHGRILTDLDLMVSDETLPEVLSALEAIGYQCEQADTWSKRVPVILSRETDVGTIDLHHQAYGYHPVLSHDDIMKGAALVDVGGGTAWLPSPAMQLAILVVHDQLRDRDYWRGSIDLRHLLDSAALARSREGVDWRALDVIFPAGYPKRALLTHLVTLQSLLKAEIPPHLLSGLRPRVQFRRRMLQIQHPALQLPLTVVSLITDPPWFSLIRIGRTIGRSFNKFEFSNLMLRSAKSVSRIVKGFFQSRDVGKF